MTQDEIIAMVQKAGFEVVDGELRLYFDGNKALLKLNYMGTVVDGLKDFAALVAAHERDKQAEQEPVAVVKRQVGNSLVVHITGNVSAGDLLYTRPVRTKDLTDDEIEDAYMSDAHKNTPKSFARAVIAADGEKNK